MGYTGLPPVLADEIDEDWRNASVEFIPGRDAYWISAENEAAKQFVGAYGQTFGQTFGLQTMDVLRWLASSTLGRGSIARHDTLSAATA
ncbi:hypothetical protein [Burkholderia guangdongensis]|uniref:hypothetical protein n=1 Tax=Burkholderia guangdongensis TaxID=1792500 RepID=UPI001FE447D3|nr:hypothetical protein [Burkholderia guangdongensis]